MKKILSIGIPVFVLVLWGYTLENLPSSDIEGAGYYTFSIAVVGVAIIVSYLTIMTIKYVGKNGRNTKTVSFVTIGIVSLIALMITYYLLAT